MSEQQNTKAKCNLCDVFLSRTNGTTTGMRKHLFLMHTLECVAITTRKKQSKLTLFSIDEKKKLDSLVISCIIQDGRGFGELRWTVLLQLFNHLLPGQKVVREKSSTQFNTSCTGYVSPHHNIVQRRLQQFQPEHELVLIKELSNVHSIGIIFGLGSDKQSNSYMCLTGQYVTISFDGSFLLLVLELPFLLEYISAAIKKKLNDLKIRETTRTIMIDGATNMLQMGDTIIGSNKRVHCEYHFSITS